MNEYYVFLFNVTPSPEANYPNPLELITPPRSWMNEYSLFFLNAYCFIICSYFFQQKMCNEKGATKKVPTKLSNEKSVTKKVQRVPSVVWQSKPTPFLETKTLFFYGCLKLIVRLFCVRIRFSRCKVVFSQFKKSFLCPYSVFKMQSCV